MMESKTRHAHTSTPRPPPVFLLLTLLLPATVFAEPARGQPIPIDARITSLRPEIINGVRDWGSPSVGFFLHERTTDTTSCSGTLIGCRTFLTAAHCVCTDFATDPPEILSGTVCQRRGDLLDPATKRVFFQHAGFFAVSDVVVAPDFQVGARTLSDLAVIELERPVTGVRPSRTNETRRSQPDTPAAIVGFGRTGGGPDDLRGLKRSGRVTIANCRTAPRNRNVCFDFRLPFGPPGTNSTLSGGDSGGPLFVDLGAGPRVAGVASGGSVFGPPCGSDPDCFPSFNARYSDVFVEHPWLEAAAGADLHTADCGSLPFAGEDGSSIRSGSGTLSSERPEASFSLRVPTETAALRVGLNAEAPVPTREVDFVNHFGLYVRQGAPPTPTEFDCASLDEGGLQFCEIVDPTPGTWHILVQRLSGEESGDGGEGERGEGELQVTTTLFDRQEPTTCVVDATTHCLQDGRFRVRVRWRGFRDREGEGQRIDLTEDTGLFWFFEPKNAELLVKVLDACHLPSFEAFWVFLGAVTTVEYEVEVLDTMTGLKRRYSNALGEQPIAVTDTEAFATCP